MNVMRYNSHGQGNAGQHRHRTSGWTLVELLIAVVIGLMVLAVLGALSLYGLRSFVAIGNYADLDAKSRTALDHMSRDIRQAGAVVSYQTNASQKSFKIAITNADSSVTFANYIWEAATRKLRCDKTGAETSTEYFLTECDRWDFAFYTRVPHTSSFGAFYPSTNGAGTFNLAQSKLIDMTWKCSRTMLGKKWNTESVQTAQFVLRNKP